MPTEYVNPCGIVEPHKTPLAARRPLAQVTTIGLFSNLKANATLFLEELGKRLKQRYPQVEFLRMEKIASGPGTFDQRWLSRVQAVAAAFGD